jgi:ribosomal protein S21
MAVRIELQEDEPLDRAISRFKKSVQQKYRRNWVKRRYGYFENPSTLRRRRASIDRITRRRSGTGMGAFRRNVHFREQFER